MTIPEIDSYKVNGYRLLYECPPCHTWYRYELFGVDFYNDRTFWCEYLERLSPSEAIASLRAEGAFERGQELELLLAAAIERLVSELADLDSNVREDAAHVLAREYCHLEQWQTLADTLLQHPDDAVRLGARRLVVKQRVIQNVMGGHRIRLALALVRAMRADLIEMLRKVPPLSVRFGAFAGDAETKELVAEFHSIFHDAGWTVGPIEGLMTPGNPEGVLLRRPTGDPSGRMALAVIMATGLEYKDIVEANQGGIEISVYFKPRTGRNH